MHKAEYSFYVVIYRVHTRKMTPCRLFLIITRLPSSITCGFWQLLATSVCSQKLPKILYLTLKNLQNAVRFVEIIHYKRLGEHCFFPTLVAAVGTWFDKRQNEKS